MDQELDRRNKGMVMEKHFFFYLRHISLCAASHYLTEHKARQHGITVITAARAMPPHASTHYTLAMHQAAYRLYHISSSFQPYEVLFLPLYK